MRGVFALSTSESYADWALTLAQGNKIPGSGIVSEADALGLVLDQNDVMPSNTTAADKCRSCFIIHSHGQTECW